MREQQSTEPSTWIKKECSVSKAGSGIISIVLPTRNEPSVESLITQIRETMRSIRDDYEILAVDKSTDDTPSRLNKVGVRVIAQQSRGLGGAIVEGLRFSRGDPIILMDADLSHNPESIPAFLEESSKGFDIVIGSRRSKGGGIVGWGLYRKTVSKVGNLLGRWIAGVRTPDVTSGYRLYRREVVDTLNFENFKAGGYAFQLEVLAAASEIGFKIGEVPIVFQDRVEGVSKLSKKDVFEFLLTSTRLGLRRLRRALSKAIPIA